jgi:sugar phosphate isomerase/epimerase
MQLAHGLHLAYCTNIHRGESWDEILAALERHTLSVRRRVCPDAPYAIGLRLGAQAARELSDSAVRAAFRRWLDRHQCYVFTINGFPYGRFHGTRVKEQVYAPDWTSSERLDYTRLLFDLLAEIVPAGVPGSVSTVPGSFKAFIRTEAQARAMRDQLWRCVEHISRLSDETAKDLHLDLEPEPLCYLETSAETAGFFDRLRDDRPGDGRLDRHLAVNYDTCHLAVQFEKPAEALARFRAHDVRVGKLHLSSAIRVHPTPDARVALAGFADPVYFHQTIVRRGDGALVRYADLPEALEREPQGVGMAQADEWRVHYHIPLHAAPQPWCKPTTDHLLEVLDALGANPGLCRHLEMETYTWEVLPQAFKHRSVEDQLVDEYRWTLDKLAPRLATAPPWQGTASDQARAQSRVQ